MIVHLLHAQIDPVEWDRRMGDCRNASWYGLSSTLNAAAPGWNALVDEATGSRMPLPWRRKYGIRYLYQPFLVQHLGPYAPVPSAGDATRFLRAIPAHYRYADIHLLGTEVPSIPHVRTEERTNHLLRLDAPLESLREGYSANHRRSLRKAEKLGASVQRNVGSAAVIGLIEGSEQFVHWGVDAAQRATMRRVIQATEEAGNGFGRMVVSGGEPVAGAWFVRGTDRIIFLKGIGSQRGRELRAMHALIDDVILEFAASGMVFDLAGGNDPQLARFYSGFGAEPALYLRALMNRLPPLFRRMKP
jgi:hypothetical protein